MQTVAVLFGGRGSERQISCQSSATVLSHISREQYRVIPVGIDVSGNFWQYLGATENIADGSWAQTPEKQAIFPIRKDGKGFFRIGEEDVAVDVILPVLHGDFGEDGRMQGFFETVGIPYVGADTVGGVLGFDKVVAKRIAESVHIPVVPWISVFTEEPKDTIKRKIKQKFGSRPFPLFVKPSALGSSIGAAKVRSYAALWDAVAEAGRYGEVLIEQYIAKKRELEIAFLDGDLPLFSEVGEIVSKHGFYSFREKYEKQTAKIGKAHLSMQQEDRLYRYAENLLLPLHIRDLCRFDFFLTDDGALFFNEVNTMPGLTDISLYPKLLSYAGFSLEALIERWVSLALARGV